MSYVEFKSILVKKLKVKLFTAKKNIIEIIIYPICSLLIENLVKLDRLTCIFE